MSTNSHTQKITYIYMSQLPWGDIGSSKEYTVPDNCVVFLSDGGFSNKADQKVVAGDKLILRHTDNYGAAIHKAYGIFRY